VGLASRRAKTLARFTKGAVVLFPFEVEFLRGSGVNAVFAGHPILEEIAPFLDASPDPGRFGLPAGKRVVGLSRKPAGEVAVHLPILLSAARLLLRRFADLHFALPVARPSLRGAIAREVAGAGLPVTLVDEGRHLLFRGMAAADGRFGDRHARTRLLGTPAVIVYRTSWLSYQIGRRLATVDCVGLPTYRRRREVPSGVDPGRPAPLRGSPTPWRKSWPIPRGRETCARGRLSLREKLRGPGPPGGGLDAREGGGGRMGLSLYRRMLGYVRRTFRGSSSRWS